MDKSAASTIRAIARSARAKGQRTQVHLEVHNDGAEPEWVTTAFPEREPFTRIIATIDGARSALGNKLKGWEYGAII